MIVFREVTVGGNHRLHSCGPSRDDVTLGIADVHAMIRRHAGHCRSVQQGQGMGLAFVDRVAAYDAAGATAQAELLQQRVGEPARLVRHDAPGQVLGLEGSQHLLEAREQSGACRQVRE